MADNGDDALEDDASVARSRSLRKSLLKDEQGPAMAAAESEPSSTSSTDCNGEAAVPRSAGGMEAAAPSSDRDGRADKDGYEKFASHVFFVRLVAQREYEATEDEWLKLRAAQRSRLEESGYSRTRTSGMALGTGMAGGSGRTTQGRAPGELPRGSSTAKLSWDDMYDERLEERMMRKAHGIASRVPILHVLSPFSACYIVWQYFMMLVDFTYTAFYLPYSVVFNLEDCRWSAPSALIDLVVGYLFVLDVMFNLRVGFAVNYKLSRALVLDPWRSAWFYVRRGTFIVDFPATIPVFLQTGCLVNEGDGVYAIKIAQAMRLLRLLRLGRALRLLTSDALDVASIGLKRATGWQLGWFPFLQIFILFGWTAHLIACIWYYTAALEDAVLYGEIVPARGGQFYNCQDAPPDVGEAVARLEGPISWLEVEGLLCASNGRQYLAAFYFSTMTITTVGYGDVSAGTAAEQAVASVLMFIGAIFFGYLVSTTTIILEKFSAVKKEVSMFHDKVDVVETWAKQRNLPRRLQRKVMSYYSMVWSNHSRQHREAMIMSELPFPIKSLAAENITMSFLDSIPALQRLEREQWVHISRRLWPVWIPPGQFLAFPEGKGDASADDKPIDSVWFLERGKIGCYQNGRDPLVVCAPQMLGASLVLRLIDGGVPLESDRQSYMTVTPVWLWRIKKGFIVQWLRTCPGCLAQLIEGILLDQTQMSMLDLTLDQEQSVYDALLRAKRGLGEDDLAESHLRAGAETEDSGLWVSPD